MEKFYYDVITFLGGLNPAVKVLVIGLLLVLDVLCLRNIVKTHVNPKKTIFKLSQFFLLAILVALTIFVSINVF